jgi:hypothetical protein
MERLAERFGIEGGLEIFGGVGREGRVRTPRNGGW